MNEENKNKNEKELSEEKLDKVSGGVLPINHLINVASSERSPGTYIKGCPNPNALKKISNIEL